MDALPKKILVVDHSRIMQSIYSKLLAGLGEVSPCNTVQQACEWVETDRYGLIITDYLFARSNGLDLIQHVRKSYSAMQLPILMVSASMDPCLRQDAIKTGANYCMGKPPDFKQLAAVASELLKTPFVDVIDEQALYYTAVSWLADDKVFFFCPEFHVDVCAATEEEAVAQLEEKIQAELAKGMTLKRISPPSVNRLLLKT